MPKLYRNEKIDPTICPTKRNIPLESLRTIWNLVWPSMHDERSVIQVSGKYVVSIGAHWDHNQALIAKSETIDYYTALEVCDLLSFVFDSIVALDVALRPTKNRNIANGLKPYFRLFGYTTTDPRELQRLVIEPVGMVGESDGGLLQRILPPLPGSEHLAVGIDLPRTSRLRDAVFAYRQALLAVDPAGAILNYWRVLEATTNSKAQRQALMPRLFPTRLSPVWCVEWVKGRRPAFDLIPRYKRFLRPHYRRLVARHGSPAEVVDFLYYMRRCPSAHAKTDVLRPGATSPLAELYSDALLMKCLARLAIEDAW
jgi:hypothetical protein